MEKFKILEEELTRKKWSRNKLGLESKINPSNLSQALNGNIPMFPGWRKRIAGSLGISEAELFPEYQEQKKVGE